MVGIVTDNFGKMTETDVAFENLKSNIIRKSEGSLDLEKVKECFSPVINSKRSLSRVKNLSDIFYLLEERDALDSENIYVLEYLSMLLQNQEISKLIRGYKKLYIDSDDVICSICGLDNYPALPIINSQTNSPENEKNDDLECAFENIAKNIGKDWRLLVSELVVPEAYVDLVREKYPQDYYQQALRILQIWKNYNQEAATMDVLKNALEARLCKRKGIGLHMLKPVIKV